MSVSLAVQCLLDPQEETVVSCSNKVNKQEHGLTPVGQHVSVCFIIPLHSRVLGVVYMFRNNTWYSPAGNVPI